MKDFRKFAIKKKAFNPNQIVTLFSMLMLLFCLQCKKVIAAS